MKVLCEVVSNTMEGKKKVGEEVRFYDTEERGKGPHVKTVQITDPEKFGTYKEGESYELSELPEDEAQNDAEEAIDEAEEVAGG